MIDAPDLDTPPVATESSTGPGAPLVEDPASQGWRKDKKGRWFVGAKGRAGVIYRQGDESVDEAIERDQQARINGRPPKSRPKPSGPDKAPAPTRRSSKELEAALTETLQSPAMIAAMKGDTWVAEHVYREAPTLSRNLVAASEHNPKLRARLEAIAGGESSFGQLMMQLSVAGALIAYAVPPLVYYLGDRAPGRLRETFQVPEKSKKQPRPTPEDELADMDRIAQEMADRADTAGA